MTGSQGTNIVTGIMERSIDARCSRGPVYASYVGIPVWRLEGGDGMLTSSFVDKCCMLCVLRGLDGAYAKFTLMPSVATCPSRSSPNIPHIRIDARY